MRTTIRLAGDQRRTAVMVDPDTPAPSIRRQLRLSASKGLIVFNGGTADLSEAETRRLGQVLGDGLMRVVAEDGLTLLTGATDAGVFKVLGDASERRPGKWRMIGVAPSKLVSWDRQQTPADPDRVPLEPHHTDFVLVDTGRWGGETRVMLDLAREIGRREPTVAVLASGGEVTRSEVLGHIRERRPIIVLAGTGRLADEITAAHRAGRSDTDPELNEIVYRGQLTVVDIDAGEAAQTVASAVRAALEDTRLRARRQRPALLRRLPRLRWPPSDTSRQFVALAEQLRYPALAGDFAFLNDHLLDTYRACDSEALRQQNGFYLANLVAILGSLAATILGIVQAAAVPGKFWFGLAETVLAAALGGGVLVTTGRTAQRGYYTNRLKAERLRSEYFLFLARHGPYADDATRQRVLIDRVTAIEITTMSGPTQ